MNLLDLAVKITCDDQASGQVEGIGSRITGTLGKAAGVVSAVMGSAAVAGAVALGKSALDAYASYEQLVGGVDTLFKGASGQLQAYAAQAYQTAGMSANQYMETATSFSASLIQGLGGDTQRAVEVANMAITDMSDNANKMGTDIDVIREAYQGFAKDNYDMLDNLKLGYGGTQAEMARLINDTGVMGDSFKATAKNVNEVPFDKMIEAIHQVQTEMGITGTTSMEAATTIEGSVNTMKAAWENWLTGLGNENADISALTDQLMSSIGSVIGNVGPRVGEIVGTLVMELVNRGPEIAQSLGSMLSGAFTDAFNLVAGIVGENTSLPTIQLDDSGITGFVTSVQGALGDLASSWSTVIEPAQQIAAVFLENVGPVFETVGNAITTYLLPSLGALGPMFSGLLTAIQPWIEPLMNVASIIGTVVVVAITTLVNVLGTVIGIITGVINGLTGFATFLQSLPETVSTFVQGVVTFFSQLPGSIASFLGSAISSVVSWVGQMASNAMSAGSQFVSNVASFISSLPGQIAGFLGGVISNVASWVGQMASNAVNAASQFASNLISGLQSIPGRVVSIGRQIIQGMVDGVVGAAGMLIDAVGGAVSDAIGWAKGLLGIASPSKVFREIGQFTMQGAALGVDDDAPMLARSTEDAMRGMVRSATSTRAASYPAAAGAGYGDLVEAVESLHEDLGRIISRYTPTMDKRYFRSAVRSVVA